MFLDREIQKKLLSVDDEEDEDELQRSTIGEYSSVGPANGALSRGKNAGARTLKAFESFEPWCPEVVRKQRRTDKQQRSIKDREPPKWEIMAAKDYRPKEITVSFRHYEDWRSHMDHYRKEHTYNFGPLEGKDFELPSPKLYPTLDRSRQQNGSAALGGHTTPPSSARSTTRTLSDTNLLELAGKCKLTRTLGVRCYSGELTKRDLRCSRAETKPESAPEAQSIPNTDAAASKSQHNLSAAGKVGGKGLAPLNGVSPKVSSLTASSASAMKITAIGTAPKRLDGLSQNGAAFGNKKGKGSNSNGYILEKMIR